MELALVDEQRRKAKPGLSGKCQICHAAMVARCGDFRVWHWAHLGRRTCDPWWENESEWHRAWKRQFPDDWHEVVLRAKSGEKHIADVKTSQDWVLEFQHSYLKPEERRARDAFYPKLVWVVNGSRRKRDKSQFFNALQDGVPVSASPPILRVFSDECALLREWAGIRAPVFFDFGEVNKPEETVLWCLLPGSPNGAAYVAAFRRAGFIELHRTGATRMGQSFAECLSELKRMVSHDISRRRAQTLNQLARQPQNGRSSRPQSFRQYLSRKQRRRSRTRL